MDFNLNITDNYLCEYINTHKYYENVYDSNKYINMMYFVFLLMSLYLTYFGNTQIKKIMTCIAFIPGFYVSYYGLTLLSRYVYKVKCPAIIITSLFAGGLTAMVSKWFVSVSYTCLGLLFGISIGYILYILVFQHLKTTPMYIYNTSFFVTEGISGLIGAYIFQKKKIEFMMIFTSFIGAYETLIYIDKLLSVNYKYDFINVIINKEKISDKKGSYMLFLYVMIYMVLSLTGLYVQYNRHKKKTIKNPYNINAIRTNDMDETFILDN